MTSGSVVDGRACSRTKSWARPHSAGRRPLPIVRHLLQGAGRRRRQQQHQGHVAVDARADGRDARCADAQGARHDPRAAGRRRRASAAGCASSSSGSATAWYGYGWRSYDYAGHHIVGHRGGISGYRSLILFDPAEEERRGRAVEQQYEPARRPRVRGDGHDLSACRSATGWSSTTGPATRTAEIAATDPQAESGSGDAPAERAKRR